MVHEYTAGVFTFMIMFMWARGHERISAGSGFRQAQAGRGVAQETALDEVGSMSWGQFKGRLADAVVAHLEPLQDAYKLVVADPTYLDEVRYLAL